MVVFYTIPKKEQKKERLFLLFLLYIILNRSKKNYVCLNTSFNISSISVSRLFFDRSYKVPAPLKYPPK